MPLILGPTSPLVFSGRKPGFDPTHPAAYGIAGNHGLSAVFSAGSFVNLVTGAVGARTLAAGASVACNSNGFGFNNPGPAGFTYAEFTGTTIQDTVGTMAIIGTYNGASTGGSYFCTDSGQTGGLRLDVQALTFPTVTQVLTFITMPVAPIFYAASKTGASVSAVVLNLATGKILTTTQADSTVANAPGAALQCVGSKTANDTAAGAIAAAMWAPVGLSQSQLLQWAQDPWAFWYPHYRTRPLSVPPALTSASYVFGVGQGGFPPPTRMIGY